VGLTNTGSGAAGTTALGASIAVAAFTVTAFYQVWIGKKIKDFNVSSPQLLLNQAPISVLILALMVPFFDTIPDVSLVPQETRIALFLSGFAAALLVRPLPSIHLIRLSLTSTESFPISHYWKNERIDL
jgi:solute carrier family 35 protein E3